MMRGFYPGLIAGIIGGIVGSISIIIGTMIGLPHILIGVPLTFELMISHLGYNIGATGIFGGIFGIVYSKFYNGIPSEGLKKGIVFGLLTYLFQTHTNKKHEENYQF